MSFQSAIEHLSGLAGVELSESFDGWAVVSTEGCDIHADFITESDQLQVGIHEVSAAGGNVWQSILQGTPPEFGTEFAVVDGSRAQSMDDLRSAVGEDLEFYVVLDPSDTMMAALKAWLEPFGEHCPILCITART